MAGLGGGEPRPDDFLADLARWAAADKTSRAASERARTRDLLRQSAAGATWEGVLVDLAERAADVTVWLAGGDRLAGRLVGVGRDFTVVEERSGRPVLVRTGAVSALAPRDDTRPGIAPSVATGRRRPPLDLTLAAALDALAGEEAPVVVHSGSDKIAGTLLACGADLVTVRTGGGNRHPVYVPLDRLACVELR